MFFFISHISVGQKTYYISNLKIFKETEIWPLAKAVKRKHFGRAKHLLRKHPEWINFREPNHQFSLLHWMFANSTISIIGPFYKYDQAKFLIENGANPYLNSKDTQTPISYAGEIFSDKVKFLKLCLESEYTSKLADKEKILFLSEALSRVCYEAKEDVLAVKYLISNGADVNYFYDTRNCLMNALGGNFIIALYLINEAGADYNLKLYFDNGNSYNILQYINDIKYENFADEENKVIFKAILELVNK
jgi:ankyrin repeat protein